MALTCRFFLGLFNPIVTISKTLVSEICAKKYGERSLHKKHQNDNEIQFEQDNRNRMKSILMFHIWHYSYFRSRINWHGNCHGMLVSRIYYWACIWRLTRRSCRLLSGGFNSTFVCACWPYYNRFRSLPPNVLFLCSPCTFYSMSHTSLDISPCWRWLLLFSHRLYVVEIASWKNSRILPPMLLRHRSLYLDLSWWNFRISPRL